MNSQVCKHTKKIDFMLAPRRTINNVKKKKKQKRLKYVRSDRIQQNRKQFHTIINKNTQIHEFAVIIVIVNLCYVVYLVLEGWCGGVCLCVCWGVDCSLVEKRNCSCVCWWCSLLLSLFPEGTVQRLSDQGGCGLPWSCSLATWLWVGAADSFFRRVDDMLQPLSVLFGCCIKPDSGRWSEGGLHYGSVILHQYCFWQDEHPQLPQLVMDMILMSYLGSFQIVVERNLNDSRIVTVVPLMERWRTFLKSNVISTVFRVFNSSLLLLHQNESRAILCL